MTAKHVSHCHSVADWCRSL